MLTIERGDYYQSGLIIRKGGFDQLRAEGLDALRERIVAVAPLLASVVGTLTDWDQVKLLSVQLDRLSTWHRDGLVCIGDAAHAMSPVGGVGINYAIQDAVALANAIAGPLAAGRIPARVLAEFQRRRSVPVERMQRIQRLVHARIDRTVQGRRVLPPAARALFRVGAPLVRRVMARLIGLGFRPEHVAR